MILQTLDILTLPLTSTLPISGVRSDGDAARAISVLYVAVGDPTAITMNIEGSLDGTTWVVLGTTVFSAGELTALSATDFVFNTPVIHVRATTAVLTFATSCSITTQISVN